MDWSWLKDIGSGIVDAGATVYNSVVSGAEWVIDEVDDIFGEGVGMGALSGAVVGGLTAAITGEDIVDGALWGGAAGGVIGGIAGASDSPEETTEGTSNAGATESGDPLTLDDKGMLTADLGVSEYGTGNLNYDQASGFSLLGGSEFNVDLSNPGAALAVKGIVPATALNSGVKITKDLGLDFTQYFGVKDMDGFDLSKVKSVGQTVANGVTETKDSGSVFGKIKGMWSNTSDELKASLIGNAIKGGATAYAANQQSKALKEMKEQEYQRNKAKVGGVSGARSTASLDKGAYNSSRPNPYYTKKAGTKGLLTS